MSPPQRGLTENGTTQFYNVRWGKLYGQREPEAGAQDARVLVVTY